jgi:hypothetical protein
LNWTDVTPEPASVELALTVTALPLRLAEAAGALIEEVGAVLSTRTLVMVPELKVLPALSVVTTLKSYSPSVRVVVFSEAEYGLVVSVLMVVQVLVPAGLRWKAAEATPEVTSAESEVRLIVPLTVAEAAGAVRLPVGLVLSTVTVTTEEVVVLPALSVVTAVRL